MTDRYLIVGLGNPGREYDRTRHNIGFRAVDAIAAAGGLTFAKKQGKAAIAEGIIAEKKVLLAKPQTFMNLSGESVRELVNFYKIPLSAVLVISDDLDIPLGTLRGRQNGGSGGQNGIKSIMAHLGTQEFARLRVGIGRPPGRMLAADYVLQPFRDDETILVIETLDRIVKAAKTWLTDGLPAMMTQHNGTAEEASRNAAPRPKPVAPAAPINEPPKPE
jgi:peptidyl-tRNA hydrolase, PTH1 family